MCLTSRSSRDRFAASLMRYRVTQRSAAARPGLTQVLGAMNKFVAIVTMIMSLAFPMRALACSIAYPPDPDGSIARAEIESRFHDNQIVVLAFPVRIELAPHPTQGKYLSLLDPYEQIIDWEVLYSWKGSHPGAIFQTTKRIEPRDPCVGYDIISGPESNLIYAKGTPPYNKYQAFRLGAARRDFLFLQTFNVVPAP